MQEGESGISLRIALEALQEISGEQYPRLLRAAGLGQFVNNLPPATPDMVVTFAEWGGLFHNVYMMLGADFLRLFGRNLATASMKPVLAGPGIAQLRAAAQEYPPDQRLGFAVRRYGDMMSRNSVRMDVREEPAGWALIIQDCPMCKDITGLTAPVCPSYPTATRLMLEAILGHKVHVEERACHACGAPHCEVFIAK